MYRNIKDYVVFSLACLCLCIVASPSLAQGSAYWVSQNVLVVEANPVGGPLEVELRSDHVDVEMLGFDARFDIDRDSVIYIQIKGSRNDDDILIDGRDSDDLDYRVGVTVAADDGDDYVENDTDNTMIAMGGYGSDVLIGGDGLDYLLGLANDQNQFKFEDRNDHDVLIGGGGNDYFVNRVLFYKSYKRYFLVQPGQKDQLISKSQYNALRRQRTSRFGRPSSFSLKVTTSYRLVSQEIAQIVDLENNDTTYGNQVRDGEFYRLLFD